MNINLGRNQGRPRDPFSTYGWMGEGSYSNPLSVNKLMYKISTRRVYRKSGKKTILLNIGQEELKQNRMRNEDTIMERGKVGMVCRGGSGSIWR